MYIEADESSVMKFGTKTLFLRNCEIISSLFELILPFQPSKFPFKLTPLTFLRKTIDRQQYRLLINHLQDFVKVKILIHVLEKPWKFFRKNRGLFSHKKVHGPSIRSDNYQHPRFMSVFMSFMLDEYIFSPKCSSSNTLQLRVVLVSNISALGQLVRSHKESRFIRPQINRWIGYQASL